MIVAQDQTRNPKVANSLMKELIKKTLPGDKIHTVERVFHNYEDAFINPDFQSLQNFSNHQRDDYLKDLQKSSIDLIQALNYNRYCQKFEKLVREIFRKWNILNFRLCTELTYPRAKDENVTIALETIIRKIQNSNFELDENTSEMVLKTMMLEIKSLKTTKNWILPRDKILKQISSNPELKLRVINKNIFFLSTIFSILNQHFVHLYFFDRLHCEGGIEEVLDFKFNQEISRIIRKEAENDLNLVSCFNKVRKEVSNITKEINRVDKLIIDSLNNFERNFEHPDYPLKMRFIDLKNIRKNIKKFEGMGLRSKLSKIFEDIGIQEHTFFDVFLEKEFIRLERLKNKKFREIHRILNFESAKLAEMLIYLVTKEKGKYSLKDIIEENTELNYVLMKLFLLAPVYRGEFLFRENDFKEVHFKIFVKGIFNRIFPNIKIDFDNEPHISYDLQTPFCDPDEIYNYLEKDEIEDLNRVVKEYCQNFGSRLRYSKKIKAELIELKKYKNSKNCFVLNETPIVSLILLNQLYFPIALGNIKNKDFCTSEINLDYRNYYIAVCQFLWGFEHSCNFMHILTLMEKKFLESKFEKRELKKEIIGSKGKIMKLISQDKIMKEKYQCSEEELEFLRRLEIYEPILVDSQIRRNLTGSRKSLIVNLSFSGFKSEDDDLNSVWSILHEFKHFQEVMALRWKSGVNSETGRIKKALIGGGKKFIPDFMLNKMSDKEGKKLTSISSLSYIKKAEGGNWFGKFAMAESGYNLGLLALDGLGLISLESLGITLSRFSLYLLPVAYGYNAVQAYKEQFVEAYYNAILTGKCTALNIAENNFLEGRPLNLVGMSLGSLVAMFTAAELGKYGFSNRVNNLCLLGSVIDMKEFCDALHFLIGERGSIRGKIYVAYNLKDKVLDSLLSKVKRNKAIGCSRPNFELMAQEFIQGNKEGFCDWSSQDVVSYLKQRIVFFDSESIVCDQEYSGNLLTGKDPHFDYAKNYDLILEKIGFGSYHILEV